MVVKSQWVRGGEVNHQPQRERGQSVGLAGAASITKEQHMLNLLLINTASVTKKTPVSDSDWWLHYGFTKLYTAHYLNSLAQLSYAAITTYESFALLAVVD